MLAKLLQVSAGQGSIELSRMDHEPVLGRVYFVDVREFGMLTESEMFTNVADAVAFLFDARHRLMMSRNVA